MAIARLSGGPLDGQIIPLQPDTGDSLIVPFGEGQLIYRRAGAHEVGADGPAAARFVFTESTEDINPDRDRPDA